MSLILEPGFGTIINTKRGLFRKINPLSRDNYILLDGDAVRADSEREYIINGKKLFLINLVNRYKDYLN